MPFPIKRRVAVLWAAWAAVLLPFGSPDALAGESLFDWQDDIEGREFDYDDSQDIPWIENETEVLAMPQADDLRRVALDDLPDGFELMADTSRITVDPKDRVVRLWLWVRSSSGSESGSFEGFRCATQEYKVYAYANPGREPPVSKARRPRWREVGARRDGNYRGELLRDFFCGIRGTRSAHEIAGLLTGDIRRGRFLFE